MDPEKKDVPEVHETPEVPETPETPETPEEDLTPEQIADLKKKAEASSQNFERAKKAEAELKEAREKLKQTAPSNDGDQLPQADVIYLAKADIHEDDLSEVIEYARLKKIPVKEAHSFLKPVLDVRSEERKTAATANTGPARRGAAAPTGDQLIERANKGDLPEKADDIDKLVGARMRRK